MSTIQELHSGREPHPGDPGARVWFGHLAVAFAGVFVLIAAIVALYARLRLGGI